MGENNLSFKVKIIAAISVFLFIVSITIAIIINGNYNILANEYQGVYDGSKH